MQGVALVALVCILLEKLAIRVGQELIAFERETNGMLADPGFLASQGLWLVRRWLNLDLAKVVTEFVVRHDKSIRFARILDTV